MWEWDERKRRANIAKHGVDFADIARFGWDGAIIRPDLRFDYGERRLIATGPLQGRLHMAVYTERNGINRLISLRKANSKEVREWLAEQQ